MYYLPIFFIYISVTEKTAQDEEDLDITLKHVQPQSSETDSLQPNSRPVELSSLDSSNFQRNEDLFDQLVHHFGSKSSTSSSRGRSRKRQRSSFYVPSNRRQSNSSNRRATLGPGYVIVYYSDFIYLLLDFYLFFIVISLIIETEIN